MGLQASKQHPGTGMCTLGPCIPGQLSSPQRERQNSPQVPEGAGLQIHKQQLQETA